MAASDSDNWLFRGPNEISFNSTLVLDWHVLGFQPDDVHRHLTITAYDLDSGTWDLEKLGLDNNWHTIFAGVSDGAEREIELARRGAYRINTNNLGGSAAPKAVVRADVRGFH